MSPSAALLERLLGIAEGVAAFGDQLDGPTGPRLSVAAREVVDMYWAEMRNYPVNARDWRDEMFVLLLNTRPAVIG
ncbi:hypothetical protein KIH74_01215 [Kineosporia sp. J2-2]|uniref:Uncharacterized protein n=1 Tax=Kineosporia corallincola TaxID=2835133 RepID=A0ABS5T909_9ACTN|nr:hypothetical protein [Kineosporia corallincola]MBT0767522.1 hypothetical protein [Kineosporia corallincola]